MCLRAKSSCLGRRRSRRREAPAAPLSPPPLLLSRLRSAQRCPTPPARRRPPPTPQPRRSPQALAHVCMVAATVPCPGPRESVALSAPLWSRTPGVAAASGLEPLPTGQLVRQMDGCSGAMNGHRAQPGTALSLAPRKVVAPREAPARHTLSVALGAGGGMGPANGSEQSKCSANGSERRGGNGADPGPRPLSLPPSRGPPWNPAAPGILS